MCECKEDLERRLEERFKADLPDGYRNYDARLGCYGLTLGQSLSLAFLVPYTGDVDVPKKTGGGMKRQKIKSSIKARYCPFCGEPFDGEPGTKNKEGDDAE